ARRVAAGGRPSAAGCQPGATRRAAAAGADREATGRTRGGAAPAAMAVSGDHSGRAALQEPSPAWLQVLPGACAVVPAGEGSGPGHTAGRPRQPDPGRRADMRACATATAGGVPGHRPHGPRAPHLAADAPPEVAR